MDMYACAACYSTGLLPGTIEVSFTNGYTTECTHQQMHSCTHMTYASTAMHVVCVWVHLSMCAFKQSTCSTKSYSKNGSCQITYCITVLGHFLHSNEHQIWSTTRNSMHNNIKGLTLLVDWNNYRYMEAFFVESSLLHAWPLCIYSNWMCGLGFI